MVTVLGIVTVVAVVGVWLVRRRWTQYVVAATVAFPQTAALIVGDNGFPLFYLAVGVLLVLSVPAALFAIAKPERLAPGARRFATDALAVGLLAWAAVITLAGPRIFSGMRVFDPSLGVDAQVADMARLAPSLGNMAQLGYLALAVAFLLLAGRMFPVDARMLGAVLWVSIVLAGVRLVAEPIWPHDLLQNMPGFHYATAERLSGTFYEPSVLGLYLTAAAGYLAVRVLRATGIGRIAAIAGLALVGVEFVANGSGTALLGLGILAVLGAAYLLVRQLRSRRFGVRPWLVIVGVVVIGGLLTQAPALLDLTVGAAGRKTETFSFLARGASNLRSWQIFEESFGLGIGLGANRPSSLFFLVLSCLGVIGTGLLVALIVLALRSAARTSEEVLVSKAPAAWGLIGVAVAAVVAVPDLSMPIIWVSLAACLVPAASARPVEASEPELPALASRGELVTSARADRDPSAPRALRETDE
jgi:hypothetical protein